MAFLFVVLGVLAGVHFYLWHRLVRATTRPGAARGRLTFAVAGLFVLVVVTFVAQRVPWLSWLAWPGFMWVAVMFYLFWIQLALEVPRAVLAAVLRAREPVPAGGAVLVADAPADPGRRLFIGRATALAAGVGALGTVGYGVTRALGDPVIERASVTLPGLDSRLSGLRFAVVSDIHLGPLTGKAHTERIVRMINGLEADVVAIVGDMVDGTVEALGPLARPLRDLESRYGSYFVTGNHEYYTANGPGEWVEELSDLGVRSLRNERVEIRHQGAVLDLAGVNDVTGAAGGDGPDYAAALGGRDESRPVVLLAHQPVQVAEAARHGVDLQLSGHTHGGQMVPFNLIVPLQQPVVSGLAAVDGVQVYVTRGAGFWGPPVRVGAPPEITLLEIR
ncbi:metallophosphoesterase [Nonomuraea sp. C10]|uniref:metallophosphoesterase n=1 Tax=Nonomuraea sp. C10 TaxID=2600577 RepID=UPI0011CDABCA|nr:metallophosphoesterase [Nonomuraea sp. C10]TXK34665.1 metallophosphoesterase [Nonomuraea sp. C10]